MLCRGSSVGQSAGLWIQRSRVQPPAPVPYYHKAIEYWAHLSFVVLANIPALEAGQCIPVVLLLAIGDGYFVLHCGRTEDGRQKVPSKSGVASALQSWKKSPTGIKGLDEITMGGMPKGRPSLGVRRAGQRQDACSGWSS